mmetsp:Transcript_3668/g.4533  ORF Transcript_3668/g.4533 Transcript_3668/m.4533 type:complete len:303 (-) Transcript_3668:80-988(-)
MQYLSNSVLFILSIAAGASDTATDVSSLWEAKRYGLSETLKISKHWGQAETEPLEPEYHLEYLTLRSLGELPMLIMEAANVAYTATFYGANDFKEAQKAKQPLGRLPVLTFVTEEGKEEKIFQSATIIRYLAEKTMLNGDGNFETQARVDALYETVKELPFNAEALKSGRGANRLMHYKDTSNRGNFTDYEKTASTLITFDTFLQETGTGFLVADYLTYADLALFQKLSDMSEDDQFPNWHTEVPVPKLKKFYDMIGGLHEVQRYMKSKRRLPRTERREVDGIADYYYKPGKWSSPEWHADL